MRYALIKLDRSVEELMAGLTYAIPERMEGLIAIGSLVSVPLRQDKAKGIVVAIQEEVPSFAVRPITTLLDDEIGPSLNMEQLAMIEWMGERYLSTWAHAFSVVLPPVAQVKIRRNLKLMRSDFENEAHAQLSHQQQQILRYCASKRSRPSFELVLKHFGHGARRELRVLIEQGWLALDEVQQTGRGPRQENYRLVCRIEPQEVGRGRIQALWQRLLAEEKSEWTLAELRLWPEYEAVYLRKLTELGLLVPCQEETQHMQSLILTAAQRTALEEIEEEFRRAESRPVLLHGVTGSGKTEIYLQLIAKMISQGKRCLVLVPEITLTVQLLERFRSRFGDDVAVIHSALNDAERASSWQRARSGEAKIVIGARSAVFAPLNDLGLIIMDEEHEQTFKNEEEPKYHAREVAYWRAEYQGAKLLYGSATPAIESYYLAKQGHYRLVNLAERVQARPLARIDIVDMRRELREGNRSIFSRTFYQQLQEVVARQEQAIIFHNRRGYRRMTLCRSCGCVLECPECELPLIEHQQGEGAARLRCHTCGYEREMPEICPECGSKYFRFFGIGTEKVVEECQKLFPEARVLRLDADSTSRRGTKAAIVRSFSQGQAEILVGTQMVAKGLDFPAVTLVGVLSADSVLRAPDFRGAERAFALLTQVAGRAGRGDLPGRVLIQSYAPEHPLVQAVQDQDYPAFYVAEIERRQRRREPPFSSLAWLLAASETPQPAFFYLQTLADSLGVALELRGPQAARRYRLGGRYRFQLVVKTENRDQLVEIMRKALGENPPPAEVMISLTLDPLSM